MKIMWKESKTWLQDKVVYCTRCNEELSCGKEVINEGATRRSHRENHRKSRLRKTNRETDGNADRNTDGETSS